MSSNNTLLILAAGRSIGIDGFHKLKLVSPSNGENLLSRYVRQFGEKVKIVVGYHAAELMSAFPQYEYAYNHAWYETGSAFSAHIGLDKAPVLIVPSDLVISDEAVEEILSQDGNVFFSHNTENRGINSVNVSCDGSKAKRVYRGPKRSGDDPEYCGIIKITEQETVDLLTRTCEQNPELFLIECLGMLSEHFRHHQLSGVLQEINTIDDYFTMFESNKAT